MIVYTQEYHYPSNMVLEDVSDFSDILSRGIYVQTEPGYRFVRNSNNAPDSSLPLGGYIVDDAYDMIAALDPTGDIYIASEIYHLVPATEDGYPVFRIVDNVGTTLASVIFHREGEYVKQ
jgi:hypothetical protein